MKDRSSTCPNCGQRIQAASDVCPFCGVRLQTDAPRLRISAGPAAVAARELAAEGGLGEEFSAQPAPIWVRMIAMATDLLVIAILTVAAGLVFRSGLIAVIIAVECVLFLAGMLARTGTTPGYALFRLRLSQRHAPFSPGFGRVMARGLITWTGGVVAGVGAFAVEATGMLDPRGTRRSWADRAADTVVVSVPARRRQAAPVAPSMVVAPLSQAPTFDLLENAALQSPRLIAAAAHGFPLTGSDSGTGHTAGGSTGAPSTALPVAVTPVSQPLPISPVEEEGQVMLIVDTGQREVLPLPAVVNLGRSPERTEPGDRLLTVQDPEQSVSKTHARLEHSRSGVWITDLGSTNGTELLLDDGSVERLQPGQRTLAGDGTRVRLGNRIFTINEISGGNA